MDKVRKRKSAADRKAEIIDTAIHLSAEIGPNRVTTQHLADRVGVTQPAIFRHFATKTEIWEAVAHRVAQDVTAHAAPAPDDTLAEHVTRYFRLVDRAPALPAILHSQELHAEYGGLRERFQSLTEKRREWIAGFVRDGQVRGKLRDDLSPGQAASTVLNAMSGLCLHWNLDRQGFDLVSEGRTLGAQVSDWLQVR